MLNRALRKYVLRGAWVVQLVNHRILGFRLGLNLRVVIPARGGSVLSVESA